MPAIQARFTANIDDFRRKLAEGQTVITGFSRSTTQVNRELAKFGSEFSGARVQREAESMAKALQQVGGVSKLTESEQRKLNATVTEALAKYRALGQEAPKHLQQIAKDTQAAATSGASLTKSLGTMGVPLAAVGASAIKMSTDLNRSMANVATLVPDNVKRIDEFKGAVQGLAVATGKSTEDLSGGLYEVISAIGDTGDTLKILEINAKAGAAGLATTADAINFTSAVTKTYGDTSAAAFQKVADLGFRASDLGKTSFRELAASIGGVAPLAQATGISLEELFAVMATFTGVTGNTSEVTTQMKSAITALASPSKDLSEIYQAMGVTSGEALIKQRGFVGALQDVAAAAKSMDKPLIEVLGRTEAWNLASAAAGSQAGKFSENIGKMNSVLGSSERAFRQHTDGVNKAGFAYEQYKQQVITSMQQAGDAVVTHLPGPLATAAVGFGELGGSAVSMAGELAQVAIAVKLLGGSAGLGGLATVASVAGPALAVVGSALAGWGIGRSISDVNVFGNALEDWVPILWNWKLGLGENSLELLRFSEASRRAADDLREAGEEFDRIKEKQFGIKGKKTADIQLGDESEAAVAAQAQVKLAAAVKDAATLAARYTDDLAKRGREAFAKAAEENKLYGLSLKEAAANHGIAESSLKRYVAELGNAKTAAKGARDAIGGLDFKGDQDKAIETARLLATQVEAVGGVSRLTKDQQEALNKAMHAGDDAMRAQGRAGETLAGTIRKLAAETEDWGKKFKLVVGGLDDVLAAAKKIDTSKINDILFGNYQQKDKTTPYDPLDGIGVSIDNADEKFEDWSKRVRVESATMASSIGDLAKAFGTLSQIKPLDGPLADFAELIGLMDVATKFGGGLASAFRSPKRNADGTVQKDSYGNVRYDNFSFDNFKGANGTEAQVGAYMQIGQVALAASTGSTPVLRATEVKGRGNRALRGAAAGAAEGGQFGPYGALGGAVFGAIIGAAKNPAFEDVYHRVAKNFGVELRDETAKAIADLAKAKFSKNRDAAEIFSLDSIIADAGGLKDSNVGQLTDRLRDAFSMLETGKFTAEQTTEVLDKNFGAFAAHVQKSEHLATKSFQDLIALNKRFGTESEAVKQFVEAQTQTLGVGVAKLAGPLAEQYEGLADKIEASKKKLQEFDEKAGAAGASRPIEELGEDDRRALGTTDRDKEAAKLQALLAEQAHGAANARAEFERLGVIAVGSFNASVAAGTDLLTAVNQLGPGLDTLLGLQRDLGIESENAGLAELTRFRDLVNNNQALVGSAGALGETMRALTSIGGLNVETLAAMETQGLQTFDKLKAAGFSENQALSQMAGFLMNVEEAHWMLGTPIDANTQALINQAREAGLLKGKTKEGTKVMEEGFDKVVGVVGLLAKGLGQTVPAAIQEAIDKLNELPRTVPVDVNINYNDPGWTPPSGGDVDAGPSNGAAGGIYATGPTATWFGEGGEPELGGPERFMGNVLARAIRKNGLPMAVPDPSRLDRYARRGGQAPIIIQHTTLLDGQVVARNQVRHIPGQMRRLGVA